MPVYLSQAHSCSTTQKMNFKHVELYWPADPHHGAFGNPVALT